MGLSAFLERRLPFLGIPQLIAATLEALPSSPEGSLADVLAADAAARQVAAGMIGAVT